MQLYLCPMLPSFVVLNKPLFNNDHEIDTITLHSYSQTNTTHNNLNILYQKLYTAIASFRDIIQLNLPTDETLKAQE